MNRLEKTVSGIIAQVRRDGDKALLRLTEKYDGARLSGRRILVSGAEMRSAVKRAGADFAGLVKSVAKNIAAYHRAQLPRDRYFKNLHGARVGWFYAPVERVGVYLPAGKAPLVSTALMTVVPARVAGVKEIFVATPPRRDGKINPYLLAACWLLGVKTVVRAGGAQAVAAMALGTKSVPRADLIVGPGNIYVTEAKRRLYGKVGIDMTAGPSEVAIIADGGAPPESVAADLLSQAEHDKLSRAVLFSTSGGLIDAVKNEIRRRALAAAEIKGIKLVKCRSVAEAVKAVNLMAPEHVQVITKDADKVIARLRNAGAVFAGPFSATALGDYVAGPSHVLPTGGSARFMSVLSVGTFLKRISYVRYDEKSAAAAVPLAERLAEIEGLAGHALALRRRLKR